MSDAEATKTEPKVTVASIIRQGLREGQADEAILAAVKEQLPEAKTGANSVAFYRSQMRKAGELPAFERKKKEAGDTPADETTAGATEGDAVETEPAAAE